MPQKVMTVNGEIELDSLGITHFSDLKEALQWCDVANVLRIQLERQDVNYFPSLREYTMIYGINNKSRIL